MIQARRVSVWHGRYDITMDGQPVAMWQKSDSRTGGTLEWESRRYLMLASLMGGTASLTAAGGPLIATAHDVGRARWTIHADGTTYAFRRGAPWRQEEKLLVQGRHVGSIKRTNIVRGNTAADLPEIPLVVELFALTLVLTVWDATAAW
jgi:hypothetical protein